MKMYAAPVLHVTLKCSRLDLCYDCLFSFQKRMTHLTFPNKQGKEELCWKHALFEIANDGVTTDPIHIAQQTIQKSYELSLSCDPRSRLLIHSKINVNLFLRMALICKLDERLKLALPKLSQLSLIHTFS